MDRGRRMVDGCGIAGNSRSTRNQMVYPRVYCFRSKTMTMIRWGKLPRAVVKVGVPRGPGAVEGKGELLVVLVLLTPHPESREHLLQINKPSQNPRRTSTEPHHPPTRTGETTQVHSRCRPAAGFFCAGRALGAPCVTAEAITLPLDQLAQVASASSSPNPCFLAGRQLSSSSRSTRQAHSPRHHDGAACHRAAPLKTGTAMRTVCARL